MAGTHRHIVSLASPLWMRWELLRFFSVIFTEAKLFCNSPAARWRALCTGTVNPPSVDVSDQKGIAITPFGLWGIAVYR